MTAVEAARRLLASPLLRELARGVGHEEVFLTGGALRDRLLGRPTHDLDLAVVGDPRVVAAALARRLRGRCFALGRPPLLTWRVAGRRLQVDVWGIAGEIEHDVWRRDFTVNAIFWRLPRGPLLDLAGGLDDLAAGTIRVVRPENLRDDPLRVLRGVRMLATHPCLRLTGESERLLAGAVKGLRRVARERVCDELGRLLAGPGAARALATAVRLGAVPTVFPAWEGYRHTPDVVAVAGALAALRARRGPLARGAHLAAVALLAAPAAGFPERWEPELAASSLAAGGWPAREASRAADAAAAGERLLEALAGPPAAARVEAAAAGDLFDGALAWATARGGAVGRDLAAAGRALAAWRRRFATRPPLLSGDEVAGALALPPGPARAEAVRALRLAQAAGRVRTAAQARRLLAAGSLTVVRPRC